jgi:hypothetical protein
VLAMGVRRRYTIPIRFRTCKKICFLTQILNPLNLLQISLPKEKTGTDKNLLGRIAVKNRNEVHFCEYMDMESEYVYEMSPFNTELSRRLLRRFSSFFVIVKVSRLIRSITFIFNFDVVYSTHV